jgi:rod shape determining protein RodA
MWRQLTINFRQGGDGLLVVGVLFLLSVSLLTIFSTTYQDSAAQRLVWRQASFVALGMFLFFLLMCLPASTVQSIVWPLYLLTLLLLTLLFVVAPTIRGTTAWLPLGIAHLQPAELAKAALVLAVGRVLALRKTRQFSYALFLRAVAIGALPVVLVMLQPDFGTAFLLSITWFGLVCLGGLSRRFLVALVVLLAVAGPLAWKWMLEDYQRERILVFLRPETDPLGAGYALRQSLTAIGSGGILGRGLGHGPLSQLKFLPERHTDFIFASIGEELGLVGITLVLAAYALVFWRLLAIAARTDDAFDAYLTLGVFWVLWTGMVVNIGANLGLLPITGVPLPLISYGGSHLITSLALLGFAQGVARRAERWRGVEKEEEAVSLITQAE